jgi:hypothetical protein
VKLFAGMIALALLASAAAHADEGEIWVWTTDDGSIHYTDDRERIPDAFRARARVAHKEGDGSYQQIPAAKPKPPVAPAAPAAEPTPEAVDADAVAEAAWRDQARAIDGRIAALLPQVEACAGDHVNRSPGDGSRKRREEIEEAARCARAETELANARADRAALEERAHRAGAPPGWVRTPD